MPKEVDAITKLYDYLLWMIPKLDKYPRSQKFLLADRILAEPLKINKQVQYQKTFLIPGNHWTILIDRWMET